MRRWATALAAALALAVSGCAELPSGIDGDLTDGWSPPPPAQQWRPVADRCYPDLTDEGTLDDEPSACPSPHIAETVLVADLTGVPAGSSAEANRSRAFRECSKRVNGWLGGDWRTGWLALQPVLPSPPAWQGGARWFRCDLAQTSPADGDLVRRTGSLRNALKSSPVKMTCADPTIVGEQVTGMRPQPCAAKHTSEFVGVFESRKSSADALTPAELEKGCHARIAEFTGIPDDGTVRNRVGWLGFPPDDTSWRLGDRAIRCFLWLNGEKMTGSYRNAGTRKLKIHYVYR